MRLRILPIAILMAIAPLTLAQDAKMPDCKAMMQQQEQMKKHMAEMNSKLQTLVDQMNLAKGSARVDRMAAVINELVMQRSMMQKEMMDMQPMMAEHMMEHMRSGMMKGMSDSMAGCPMMKEGEKTAPARPPHQNTRIEWASWPGNRRTQS
ncbi:MAG: hypothetical protein ACXV7D_03460 [Thermoanaerobaculia bacterium]